jgi:RNA polymerase sigma factor (sigma-70 family)
MSIRAMLQSLSPRQREALVLRYYQDLPVAEVAVVLELPAGTVKSQTSRALARLQSVMTEPTTGR